MSPGRRGVSLRRKLFRAFGALAALGVLLAAVTVFAIVQWSGTEETLRGHYLRSLFAQQVRATTFQAFKEVPDALSTDDPDAREEFASALAPAQESFTQWTELADTEDERRQVELVRAAYDELVANAGRVFDFIDAGDREAAASLAENELEDQDFERFVQLTESAVASDREKRRELAAGALGIRRATTLTLVVTGVGVLAVTLLVAAYLTGDIFRPLLRLRTALDEFTAGEHGVRLEEGRGDELGAANRAFNRMAEQLGGSEQAVRLAPRHPLTSVEAAGLLRDAVADVEAELVARRISVQLDIDPTLGPLRIEHAAVRGALGELVRNALDALPERGGRLTLRAADAKGEAVSLEVLDDGDGLDEGGLDQLAERVQRGEPDGTGLQLATTVAAQHGGRLLIRARGGGGALAQLLLPRPR